MHKKEPDENNRLSFRTILLRSILYVIVVPTVIMLLFVGGFYLKLCAEASQAQAAMKTYLHSKYGEEFIVERPEKNGSGLGVEGWFEATAYPKNHTDIRFIVMLSSSGKHDGYAGAVWSKEETDRLKPIIQRIFSKDVVYSVTIQSSMTLQTKDIQVDDVIPRFAQAAAQYKQQIPYNITIQKTHQTREYQEKMHIVDNLKELAKDLPDTVDTTIRYQAQTSGGKKFDLDITITALKSTPQETLITMFQEKESL